MALQVTEALLLGLAKAKTLADARALVQEGVFVSLGRSPEGVLLWGTCEASAPHSPSVDLAGATPMPGCTCRAKQPCKHAVGLLVSFLEKPDAFVSSEPPAIREAKSRGRSPANKEAAAVRKTGIQRAALDLLERLLIDVTAAGLGTFREEAATRLAKQARQMTDAYLSGAAHALKRLAALAPIERSKDREDPEPGAALADDDRHRLMARHLVRLWTMVKKGKQLLDEKLDEGATASDSDVVLEELLGRVWLLTELRERCYTRKDLSLMELAFERYDDRAREERIEQSYLVDLADGAVLLDRWHRPFVSLAHTPQKDGFEALLEIADAAVYPGFLNRRVRWESGTLKLRDVAPSDWKRLHATASPLEKAFASFKEQIKNPLAPDEAVAFVAVSELGLSAGRPVLVDPNGTRLALVDSPVARFRSAANVAPAVGALLQNGRLERPAALLVRLWRGFDDNAVRGQPLTLVVGERRIRLGL